MTQASFWKYFDERDISGYTLIIPSVAVGNVGQLACDLLISSLKMTKMLSIYSPAHIPVIGYDPYNLNSNNLSSSCEAYACHSKKIIILQLRAPLVCKYAKAFLQEVVLQFKIKNIEDIIILTSSFAHEKKYVLSSQFRYISSAPSPYVDKMKNLNAVEHEIVNGKLTIYGAGFAPLLYDICKENSVPCLLFYKFCSEGDNVPDAYEMVQYIASFVPIFGNKTDIIPYLVQPVSWKLLFGRPPPQDIY